MSVIESNVVSNPVFKVRKNNHTAQITRVSWSKDHDVKLTELTTKYNNRNWKQIAEIMQDYFNDKGLTAKKCREHWFNFTDPNLNKTSLTDGEELFLLVYHYEYKNKWAMISKNIPTRSNNKIKNNFSSLIRKVCRKISLNLVEEIASTLDYIQLIYSTLFICQVISLKNDEVAIAKIASIHISDHIREKRLNVDQCIKYLETCTKSFIGNHKERNKIQGMVNVNKMDDIQEFITKLFNSIKKQYKPSSTFKDEDLLDIMESLVTENDLFASMQFLSPLPSSFKSPRMITVKSLKSPNVKPNDDNIFQIPEPPLTIISAIQTPIDQYMDLHLPNIPFQSPSFQSSFQSSQFGLLTSPIGQCFSPTPKSGFFSLPGSITENKEDHTFAIPAALNSVIKDPEFRDQDLKEQDDKVKAESNEFAIFSEKYLQA